VKKMRVVTPDDPEFEDLLNKGKILSGADANADERLLDDPSDLSDLNDYDDLRPLEPPKK
jgi:hypothetical protein